MNVNADKNRNTAAQINSDGRDILKTLQKRKKWPTTKTTITLMILSFSAKTAETAAPIIRMMISVKDSLKPGSQFIVFVSLRVAFALSFGISRSL